MGKKKKKKEEKQLTLFPVCSDISAELFEDIYR